MVVKIKKSDALSSLSITPLIDVVFLLLIFFLVATRFAEEDRELDVSLPSASEAKPLLVTPKELEVGISRDGHYYLDGARLSLDELEKSLATKVLHNPLNQTVRIRADRRCTWDHVVAAIDVCHKAGIHQVRPTTSGSRPAAPGGNQ